MLMRYLDRVRVFRQWASLPWHPILQKVFSLWFTLSKMYASSSTMNKTVWTSKVNLHQELRQGDTLGGILCHKEPCLDPREGLSSYLWHSIGTKSNSSPTWAQCGWWTCSQLLEVHSIIWVHRSLRTTASEPDLLSGRTDWDPYLRLHSTLSEQHFWHPSTEAETQTNNVSWWQNIGK